MLIYIYIYIYIMYIYIYIFIYSPANNRYVPGDRNFIVLR